MQKEQYLYKTVYDDLRKKIQEGELAAGQKLPPEQELSQDYGVSAITVKKALSMLAADHLVKRVRGKGSFITGEEDRKGSAPTRGKGRQPLIGAIFEHVSSSFGLELLYEMERIARQEGYRFFPCFSYGDRKLETETIRYLNSMEVAGMLIMPAHGRHYSREILRLVLADFPVVLVDKKMEGIAVASVRTDGEAAMQHLVHYLAEKGKKQIALVTVEEVGTSTLIERRAGFYQGMEAEGLIPCPECRLPYLNYEDPFQVYGQVYREHIRQYLKAWKGSLNGIVCAEYGVAMEVTAVLKELDCTDTIEVCCIDENYIGPGQYRLTHVKQDEKKMAACAMDLLLKKIRGEELEKENYLIPGIFREGPAKGKESGAPLA